MSDFDLIIRGGRVVLPDGEQMLDLGIRDGRITELSPAVFGSTDADLDATGYSVLPGMVDAWVRLSGRGAGLAEGFRRGAWALGAGGVTTYFDLPSGGNLVKDRAGFEAKRAAGEAESLVDFALWGALTPDNLGELEDLAECGVIGFHACMAESGDGLPVTDDGALLEGMLRAFDLKQIVSIYAENQSIAAHLARAAVAEGRTSMRDYLDSRPVIAELEAVQRAIMMAWETDCAVHFPQVSTGQAIELIVAAKAQGLNVSCSTSPHYLLLTETDAERLGAIAKCAPPLRPTEDAESLWAQLALGAIDLVLSGHTPPAAAGAPSERDVFAASFGITGGQSTLALLLAEADLSERDVPLPKLAELLATHAARRFRIHPQKGQLVTGADADLLIVNLNEEGPLQKETLFYQSPAQTPYLGRRLRGRVLRTLLRGRTVFCEGQIVGEAGGRLVEAGRHESDAASVSSVLTNSA